jgi:hypothetical protein
VTDANAPATTTQAAQTAANRDIAHRLAVAEDMSRRGMLVDARRWDQLEALFTDPVDVDYTSLNGGEPQTLRPAELVGGWRQLLSRLDATQHLIGNHVVTLDGDEAACAANVQGTHVLANHSGGPVWTVGGRYDTALRRTAAGWRIAALTLTVQWATGNQHIMTLAAERGTRD